MKALYKSALAIACGFAMAGMANAASVTPTPVSPWTSGNAAFECSQVGAYTYSYKIEWDENQSSMDGTYAVLDYTITISNDSGDTFDWDLDPNGSTGKVIVKAGTSALVYEYTPMDSDTALAAPDDKDISHVTFCWNKREGGDDCWIGETAWGNGANYVDQGNWAMYTAAPTVGTVPFLAGQHYTAGTLSIVCDGVLTCTITVALNDNARWADARSKKFPDRVDNNLMIQGYETAPTTTPSPGLFANKYRVEPVLVAGVSYTATVPYAPFYGVHGVVERKGGENECVE